MHCFPGTGESCPSGDMSPSPNTPSLNMKVEFVGFACEGKDHPFISLWTNGAIVERAALTVSSLLTRKEPLPYQLLECLFLNYFQDVPRGFVMQGAPPSPSDQPSSLRAEEELPIRIEQVQNRSAPKRPGWQWEEWISDSWTLVVDEIVLRD